jgi:hypothetical protein
MKLFFGDRGSLPGMLLVAAVFCLEILLCCSLYINKIIGMNYVWNISSAWTFVAVRDVLSYFVPGCKFLKCCDQIASRINLFLHNNNDTYRPISVDLLGHHTVSTMIVPVSKEFCEMQRCIVWNLKCIQPETWYFIKLGFFLCHLFPLSVWTIILFHVFAVMKYISEISIIIICSVVIIQL